MTDKRPMDIAIQEVERKLGFVFSDKSLLTQALTHTSFANTFNVPSNQRLEFLGDAVLGTVVAKFLFENFEDREGGLSKKRSNLVDEENLSRVISKMKLAQHLLVADGNPEELQNRPSVKADLFEAVLGAIFLDSNFNSASGWALNKLGIDRTNAANKVSDKKDFKTLLQENLLGKKIEYKLLGQSGKPHQRQYTIGLVIDNECLFTATGSSKKQAEQQLAYEMLTSKGIV